MRQKENSRLVFVKRAQVYHSGRVYMQALYRRRSELDDKLLHELVELSLSQYTRIRRYKSLLLFGWIQIYLLHFDRQAQSVLHTVSGVSFLLRVLSRMPHFF